jgi:hypothetical protein
MFVYKTIAGECVKSSAPRPAGAGAAPTPVAGGVVSIRHSVGQRGRNERADVLEIQSALARISPADGLVEPGRQTLQKLNALLGSAAPAQAVSTSTSRSTAMGSRGSARSTSSMCSIACSRSSSAPPACGANPHLSTTR